MKTNKPTTGSQQANPMWMGPDDQRIGSLEHLSRLESSTDMPTSPGCGTSHSAFRIQVQTIILGSTFGKSGTLLQQTNHLVGKQNKGKERKQEGIIFISLCSFLQDILKLPGK